MESAVRLDVLERAQAEADQPPAAGQREHERAGGHGELDEEERVQRAGLLDERLRLHEHVAVGAGAGDLARLHPERGTALGGGARREIGDLRAVGLGREAGDGRGQLRAVGVVADIGRAARSPLTTLPSGFATRDVADAEDVGEVWPSAARSRAPGVPLPAGVTGGGRPADEPASCRRAGGRSRSVSGIDGELSSLLGQLWSTWL